MKVFLAGGVSGNLHPMWRLVDDRRDLKEAMQVYLAGCCSRPYVFKQSDLFVLESFYYMTDTIERLHPTFSDFLLDSGAFTFMSNCKTAVDWDDYIDKYATFVRTHNVRKYLELDIDSIVGYDKVKEYRRTLESKVGWKCIPVWHKSRGYEDFLAMCDEYDYVAIGGIVTKEIKPNEYPIFKRLITEAHKRGAKIHGLGFTKLSDLPKYHFDSVDSTSWTTGNRFGIVYEFTGNTIKKKSVPPGFRIGNPRELAIHNFNEWVKFQKYAEKHL